MSLAEGNTEVVEVGVADASAAMRKWQYFPASVLSHHGARCCYLAQEWVLSMDLSQLNAGSPLTGPRWIPQKYMWGPSTWPIHWCEAVRQKTLDCGALAALAQEVFIARGVRSYPAQFIEQFTEDATRHWYKKWGGDEDSVHWILGDLIYHEGCAVEVRDNEIKMWDASAGWWINPKQFGGYGAVRAVRVFHTRSASCNSFSWGAHRILMNQWQKIGRERRES